MSFGVKTGIIGRTLPAVDEIGERIADLLGRVSHASRISSIHFFEAGHIPSISAQPHHGWMQAVASNVGFRHVKKHDWRSRDDLHHRPRQLAGLPRWCNSRFRDRSVNAGARVQLPGLIHVRPNYLPSVVTQRLQTSHAASQGKFPAKPVAVSLSLCWCLGPVWWIVVTNRTPLFYAIPQKSFHVSNHSLSRC